MRMLLWFSRPFGRSLGRRIVMQLVSIGCLFMLICLHLQYEFSNRAAAASSRFNRHSLSSNQRNYEKRFPIDDDDERLAWNDGGGRRERARTRRDEGDDDGDAELFYIDINDEQRNMINKDLSRGVMGEPIQRTGVVEKRGGQGGSSGVQLQLGRKALLSKRISSIADEYTAESGERNSVGLLLQPWADNYHSMEAETRRFFKYITKIQVQCREQHAVGRSSPVGTGSDWPWTVCFDEGSSYGGRGALRPGCVVYSFGTRSSNIRFEIEMAERGCEVHVFDPSGRMRAHILSESEQHGVGKGTLPENIVLHKTTLDWRDSNVGLQGSSSWKPSKLSAIMSKLGHDSIDIIRADLQSAEWKVLENILLDGTVSRVHQLIFNIHLNWSGFEVQGSNQDVIRFWYSVLKELERAHYKLFHTLEDKAEPSIFLGQTMPNISSTYTLGWVNNAWR
ncbi:methyltransferase-like protein 24 [Lytechinus variegatus]|uniref:methyltransferase-like protein 24 n=1 Tax=Lytechinus variegatus TaxID=7654 RepID=UPI001BB24108|nr:methyltransferase-like protein 24 [Lytechinus variegatus]XP_041462867.1 methyltransferase-like protein 24 [Lytechinus variegatus]